MASSINAQRPFSQRSPLSGLQSQTTVQQFAWSAFNATYVVEDPNNPGTAINGTIDPSGGSVNVTTLLFTQSNPAILSWYLNNYTAAGPTNYTAVYPGIFTAPCTEALTVADVAGVLTIAADGVTGQRIEGTTPTNAVTAAGYGVLLSVQQDTQITPPDPGNVDQTINLICQTEGTSSYGSSFTNSLAVAAPFPAATGSQTCCILSEADFTTALTTGDAVTDPLSAGAPYVINLPSGIATIVGIWY